MKFEFVSPELILGKKVAVVGSSGILLGTGSGKDIDSYDEVIRFNRAPTKGFETDVGSKTTLRVANSHVFANMSYAQDCGFTNQPQYFIKNLKNTKILYMAPSDWYHWQFRKDHVDESCEIYRFLWEDMKDLHNILNHKDDKGLMAGTMVVGALAHSGIVPDLFGFDVESSIVRTHYFGDRPKKTNTGYHKVSNDINIILSLTEHKKARIMS